MTTIFAIGALCAWIGICFLPTIIAFHRGIPLKWILLLVNLITLPTIIGWIGCLLWAVLASGIRETHYHHHYHTDRREPYLG